ncbi:IclR family transcriptional regulator [Prauserella muralis]|uniref:Transcriptional regulator n=1 Tax=Prauserella muralis TaxID=588067 RepID=A0A2V4AHV1_9PSEU|nr:IclR family transcriptional regulator [Prauserella muralis]PXY19488.1 transcriptional regulator [Prauserella muralis]TWE29466.1 IclR family transcriptional regulator [Prauserella muralis]
MSPLSGRNKPDAQGEDPASEDRDYSVRAVERVCSILNLVQESVDGVTLNAVAKTTQLPKSSAFRYLWTLENHRYVERDSENGLFRLGLGFVGMQSRHLEVLRERARPWLEKLRDEYDETTNLGILDGDHVIYLDIVESKRTVRLAVSNGHRDPLHSTALGKAIAAHLPEERVRALLEQAGMPARTPRTLTGVDEYLAELVRVRERGYAVDDGENEPDGRCVAVPVLGTRLPAAISLSAPASRFPVRKIEPVARGLREVVEQIAAAPEAPEPPDED